MPEKRTLKRARRAKRAGKAPSTQAGEFVREEIHHVREGKHGARSTKQAIAIGLSKARRSGVKLGKPPKSAKKSTKRSAASASRAGRTRKRTSPGAVACRAQGAQTPEPVRRIPQGTISPGTRGRTTASGVGTARGCA